LYFDLWTAAAIFSGAALFANKWEKQKGTTYPDTIY
jgi:hypothetical protein